MHTQVLVSFHRDGTNQDQEELVVRHTFPVPWPLLLQPKDGDLAEGPEAWKQTWKSEFQKPPFDTGQVLLEDFPGTCQWSGQDNAEPQIILNKL